jgi:hypothetical protein
MPRATTLPAMPASWRLLTGVGVAYLVAAVAIAFGLRDDTGAVLWVPVLLALAGVVLVAVVLARMVRRESRLDDLRVPDRYRDQVRRQPGLHSPSWWGPAAAAAACVAVTGAYVAPFLGGVGTGLFLAALGVGAAELLRDQRARVVGPDEPGEARLDRDAVRLARRVLQFAEERAVRGPDGVDAGVDAVLEGVGRYGVKVVLVGADGRVGDLLVRDMPRAQLVCELAGARVHETFSRELSGRMHNTRYEWQRMGTGSPGAFTPWSRTDEVQLREASQDRDTEDEVATGDAQPSAPARA